MSEDLEFKACFPRPVERRGFNVNAELPYGCSIDHVQSAMEEFADFLGFVNQQLYTKRIPRLESMLMPANFSSMVGEFMTAAIPKHCKTLVKNQYHNGHPDLIPAGLFPENAAQHAEDGIEIKASRYWKAWQGHNPEDTWLMVFVFDSSRPTDESKGHPPRPFQFMMVLGARLPKNDWLFAGRSATSRRTITASVTESGYQKMMANWIYKTPELP